MSESNDDRPGDSRQDAGDTCRRSDNEGDLTNHVRRWSDLIDRIKDDDPFAMEELHALFGKGVRFYFWRQLGPQELDDKIHDAFLIVVQAIRRGELRDPERLPGFVRTVVRRQVAASIDVAVRARRAQTTHHVIALCHLESSLQSNPERDPGAPVHLRM